MTDQTFIKYLSKRSREEAGKVFDILFSKHSIVKTTPKGNKYLVSNKTLEKYGIDKSNADDSEMGFIPTLLLNKDEDRIRPLFILRVVEEYYHEVAFDSFSRGEGEPEPSKVTRMVSSMKKAYEAVPIINPRKGSFRDNIRLLVYIFYLCIHDLDEMFFGSNK